MKTKKQNTGFSYLKKNFKIAAALLAVVMLLVAYTQRDMFSENPFKSVVHFEGASYAVSAPGDALLVTDRGKSRVIVVSGGEITLTIRGGKFSRGFFYAEHIAANNNYIYIADVKYADNSTRVISESIMRFKPNGRFDSVLFEVVYDVYNMPFQYGNITDMRIGGDDKLYFLFQRDSSLELYSIADDTPQLQCEISTENAPYLSFAVYDPIYDKIFAVSKNGIIYGETDAELTIIADLSETGDIPWGLAPAGGGYVYFANLATSRIMRSDGKEVFVSDEIIYNICSTPGKNLSFTDGEFVFLTDSNGDVLFVESSVNYSADFFAARLIMWILSIFAAVIVLIACVRVVAWLIKNSHGKQMRYMLAIAVSTVLTSSIVTTGILVSTISADREKTEYIITQIALSISSFSSTGIGDDLEAITAISDYGGTEFKRLHNTLAPICEAAAIQDRYLYFLLYKIEDGVLYAVMDYEDTIGVIYPLGESPEELIDIYDGRESHMFVSDSDAYGSWLFAVARVYNSQGEVVGLIEVGSNLDIEMLAIRRQIQEAIVSTAVLLVLILIFFTEITAFAEASSEPHIKLNRGKYVPEFIRTLSFIAFFADNTSTVFLPQFSAQLFAGTGLPFTETVGAALPLSAKLLFVAVASLVSGRLIDRYGMRITLVIGIILETAGLAICALSAFYGDYFLLLTGACISGCGLGTVVVSGNVLPTSCSDDARRDRIFSCCNLGAISGIVVGASAGAYIAQFVGYVFTFSVSAGILLPAIWFAVKCSPRFQGGNAVKSGKKAHSKQNQTVTMSFGTFIIQKGVFSFLLFLMFPFLTLMYFKDYLFPLFASEYGFTEIEMGQVLLFSGALAIFIAAPLSEYVLTRFKAKGATLISGALYSASMLLFAAFPTIESAIVTVVILNLAGCFGLVAQGVYFSSLRATEAYGVGKSMGFFSLFDNLSQTAGPLLFGAALVLGYSMAGWIMGLASLGLLLLFAIFGESSENNLELAEEHEQKNNTGV